MTLDTTVRRVNYQGDDRTTYFPFPFKVWGKEQVVVYCSDPATPWTETNITQRTTVTLNADNYGGAVVFANPPASGSNLAIVREGSFLQEDEYLSGSRFDAHEVEDRFDEDAAERQELLDATARSIKVPNSSTQTPEEVYEELLSGSAFVNNALAELNEKIEQANYWYNIILQEIGDVIYTAIHEVSFIVSETHIVDGDDGEGDWVCSIPNGFTYYPDTHQLLVTVDGLALTPGEHFDEVGIFGTESSQIRFKINLYQGQQVYIKAMFLGTEEFNVKLEEMNDKIEDANNDLQDAINSATKEFNVKLGEMDDKIEDANNDLQDAINSANADFEDKTNELNSFVEETTNTLQAIIDSANADFEDKTNELNSFVEGTTNTLQAIINSANADFEDKTNELNSFVEETTNTLQAIIDGLDEEIAQTEALIQSALEIVGTSENWETFQGTIDELNAIYSTFTTNELPTQGYCELDAAYYGGSCLALPGDVCYFKDTNTLHLAIDGLVLSPKYFEEVGGCICTPPLVEGGLQDTFFYGANFVKIPEGVCLYQGQELHAWTESFWGREGWEPEEYQPDITTRLYATSTSGCIYSSDDLGRCWRPCLRQASIAAEPEEENNLAQLAEPEEENNLAQLPECLWGQRIVATSDTLWAFTAPQEAEDDGTDGEQEDNNQEEGGNGNGEQENGSQEENRSITGSIAAGLTGQEDAAPPAGTLVCSTDGGLTWDCYIKNSQEENSSGSNGWQTFFGDPYAFAATDGVLVLATCNGIFCCSTGGTWDLISSPDSNSPFTYCRGLIEPASDGSGFLAVDTTPWPEREDEEEPDEEEPEEDEEEPDDDEDEDNDTSQEESAPAPKRRQIVYFGSAPSGGITYSCTNNISDVTAIVGNGQYWMIADACGQVEYASSSDAAGAWQAGVQMPQGSNGDGVNCIYTAREGFISLGSGAACTSSPRNAWKCSAEVGGTLCAGLHLPDHGLYLAVGGDTSCSYTLWSWDGLNWNCGCGVPNNAVLNNIWTSEHLPFFVNEPVTELEPMSPLPEAGDNDEEESPEGPDHCFLWGPISPTYQLKSDLCFDGSSIPIHITIDQAMQEGTGANNSHGNGATIAIYKSDTYQRLTREDLGIENNDSEDEELEALAASKESSPQAWCEFARYEASGPINANTELYTCFCAAGQSGSEEALTATESYPTCWPAGYYAAAIYNVYGGCSLQSRIPKVNFYVNRKERYSSCTAGAEPDDAEGEGNND